MPLVEMTWWMSLVQRGVTENKTLDEIINIIMEESVPGTPYIQSEENW